MICFVFTLSLFTSIATADLFTDAALNFTALQPKSLEELKSTSLQKELVKFWQPYHDATEHNLNNVFLVNDSLDRVLQSSLLLQDYLVQQNSHIKELFKCTCSTMVCASEFFLRLDMSVDTFVAKLNQKTKSYFIAENPYYHENVAILTYETELQICVTDADNNFKKLFQNNGFTRQALNKFFECAIKATQHFGDDLKKLKA